MEQITDELRQEIIATFKMEHLTWQEIDPAAPLFIEGLGLDSIDALELLVLLEKKYGITIQPEEDGRKILSSVDSIAEYIKSKASAGA